MRMEAFIERSEDPKKRLDGVLYTILTESNKLWRSNKAKGKGLGLLGVVNYGKANILGKLMGEKSYFYKVCYAGSSHVVLGVIKVSLVIKNHYILPGTRERTRVTFTKGSLYLVFRQKGGW